MIDLDSLCDISVATEIKRRGWVSMCHNGHPTHIPNSCIPKFYSNFLNIELKKNKFDVYFKKEKKYHISSDVVATTFKLPRVYNPKYPFNSKSTPTDGAMIHIFVASLWHGVLVKQSPLKVSLMRVVCII